MEAVISAWDVDSIYKIPAMLHEQRLDEIVCRKLGIIAQPADLSSWDELVYALEHPEARGGHRHRRQVRRPHRLVQVADRGADPRRHPHPHQDQDPLHRFREDREQERRRRARSMDAVLVPGGFGKRGVEGKIAAIRYARENSVPYLGICLGMQLAAIEFARNVVRPGRREQHRVRPRHAASGRRAHHRMARTATAASSGATGSPTSAARCGSAAQKCPLEPGTLAARSTARSVNERHRHRYEVNNALPAAARSDAGYKVSGTYAERGAAAK